MKGSLKKILFYSLAIFFGNNLVINYSYAQARQEPVFQAISESESNVAEQHLPKSVLENYPGALKMYVKINSAILKDSPDLNWQLFNENFSIKATALKKKQGNNATSLFGITEKNGVIDLSISENQVRGSIDQSGSSYIFYPLNNNQLHVVIKTKRHANVGLCGEAENIETTTTGHNIFTNGVNTNTKMPDACDNKLRVLIAYSDEVAAAEYNIKNYCQNVILKMNTVNANSGVNHEYELAYCGQVNYDETGKHNKDIKNFIEMDGIKTLRSKYSADVCILLVSKLDVNGRAYKQKASYNEAFAVVKYYPDLAAEYRIMAHEIAHLYGCDHDMKHAFVNKYNDGHACTHFNSAPYFFTLMYYADNCSEETGTDCDWIPYFSNPNITYKGKKTGDVNDANNARIMNLRSEAMIGMQKINNEGWADGTIKKWEYANIKAKTDVMNAPAPNIVDENFYYNFVIKPGGEAKFISGKTVTLLPGFHAQAGGMFSASIQNICEENKTTQATAAMKAVSNETNLSGSAVSLYPNPFTDVVHIKIDDKKLVVNTIDVKLYDMAGKLLLQPLYKNFKREINNGITFNASRLKPGLYYCVVTINGKQYTQKIVK